MDLGKGVLYFALAAFVMFSAAVIGQKLLFNYVVDSVPSITAQCKDGTYSTSTNDRGTCSKHGGVKAWVVR